MQLEAELVRAQSENRALLALQAEQEELLRAAKSAEAARQSEVARLCEERALLSAQLGERDARIGEFVAQDELRQEQARVAAQ